MSYKDDTDVELYDKWCAGDRRAGGELAQRYIKMLKRFVSDRVADVTAAEDVVSTTLFQLVKSRAALKDPTRFSAFVIGIARNVVKDHYRKHLSERLCLVGDEVDLARNTLDDLGIHPPDPGLGCNLVRALRRLPIEDQQILMVCYVERTSYADIAAAFELEFGTVASRLSAAKGRLREVLRALEEASAAFSTAAGFDDWAGDIRKAMDNPGVGVPRKIGRWRQVKFKSTGIGTHRTQYRRRLGSSHIEFEVRCPTPDEVRAIPHGPVSIGGRTWLLEANLGRDAHGLRLATSAGREILLTHRKASNWEQIIKFAKKLDVEAIEALGLHPGAEGAKLRGEEGLSFPSNLLDSNPLDGPATPPAPCAPRHVLAPP